MSRQGPGPDVASIAVQPTPRPILGDVSPNVRMAAKKSAGKPSNGTPLKRNLSAALNDDAGFTYLKRRKLSGDKTHNAGDSLARKRVNSLEASHVSARRPATDLQVRWASC